MKMLSVESSSVASSALMRVANSSTGSHAGGAIVAAQGLPWALVASTGVAVGCFEPSAAALSSLMSPLPASEPPADPGLGLNLPFPVRLVPGPKTRPRPRSRLDAVGSDWRAKIGRRGRENPPSPRKTARRAN